MIKGGVEVGKTYLTRSGLKAVVLSISQDGHIFPVKARVHYRHKKAGEYSYNYYGSARLRGGEDKMDLVEALPVTE